MYLYFCVVKRSIVENLCTHFSLFTLMNMRLSCMYVFCVRIKLWFIIYSSLVKSSHTLNNIPIVVFSLNNQNYLPWLIRIKLNFSLIYIPFFQLLEKNFCTTISLRSVAILCSYLQFHSERPRNKGTPSMAILYF